MDIQKEKNINNKNDVESLTEVEMKRKYNEVTKVKNIKICLDNYIVKYTSNGKESELCSFNELIKGNISEITESKKIVLPDKIENELKIFKDDLRMIWNNKGNKMYELEYKNTNLPYRYIIEFKSDLLDNVIIQETHDKSGDFIAKNIKNQMTNYPLYKLETMNLYAKKSPNSYNWDVYKANNIKSIPERIKKEKESETYYDEILEIQDHLMSQFIKSLILTASIYLSISYIGYSVSPWLLLLLIFVLIPYWKQNLLFYHIIRMFISRLILVFRSIWNDYYNYEVLFQTQ